MNWQDLHHSQLTCEQLYQILKLRNEVFIVEQNCVYPDIDGQDLMAENRHIMAWQDNQLCAYARILNHHNYLSIGRVITVPNARGSGIGYKLLEQAINSCKKHWAKDLAIYLSAQAHLQKFYSSFGFIAEGDVYDEDGIPHIKMVLKS
ncbi:GNAT family N-acetyltransferase [Entomomonas asaccharolytica]|uniref:Protein ElaA n=2 Tax=Entomomonas asaccharolytica TaxID=2785331 RepID=A0A974RXH4_9GAMM|nr:GNAT family N-acetyltransferase [Entomomonas asaccharolytica]QQP86182.1 GNAT family N-acetyltransferase [Entomomonas asaccharolytica]